MPGALDGVRLLEIGDDVAVRYAGRMFRALGAEVVRTGAAPSDAIGYGGDCGAAYGDWLDFGKRIDPAASGPYDLVLGGLEAASIERAAAAAQSCGAVLAAMRWFDRQGPYAGWRATDETIYALSGLAYAFGEADGPPTLAQGHIPQVSAAVVAFIAAMSALLLPSARRPSQVEVNVFEATLCYTETAALGGIQTGEHSVRLGVNRFVPTYPCSPYRASDGWVGVTCLTPPQWRALSRLLGRPDLAEDPRFGTSFDRLLLGDDVDAEIGPLFAARSQAEWVQLGVEHRIPIAPMTPPGELPRVEHWRDRQSFEPFGRGATLGPALPFTESFDGVRAETAETSQGGPLAGLRVIDFSMGWAGPLCCRTLGDLGADVIKVESSEHPDWWRGWEEGLDVTVREGRVNFINVNRNKRGVDLDLTRPEGRSVAARLVAGADILVENFAAGVLEKLGLGREVQRQLRPGLISLSMPAFGNGGPLSGVRAYGSTVEQASGLPFVNGEAAWPPAQQHVALGDPIAGLFGVCAVLAAVYARPRLGGAEIELAQVACLFQLNADAIIAEQVLGGPVPRTGSRRARLALSAVVPTRDRDRWVAVAAVDDQDLARLAKLTGGADPQALARWTSARSRTAAAGELQAAGLAAAPVHRSSELGDDPQLAAAGYFEFMTRAVIGRHPVARPPYRLAGERPPLGRTAPLLGEHTQEVLCELEVVPAPASA